MSTMISNPTADGLLGAAEQLVASANKAAVCIERLEARVAELEGNIEARDFTINDMCDEIFNLQQQLEGVRACA